MKKKVGDTLVSIDPQDFEGNLIEILVSVSVIMPETFEAPEICSSITSRSMMLRRDYRIKVEVLDKDNTVTATTTAYRVMPKDSQADAGTKFSSRSNQGSSMGTKPD